MFDKIVSYRFSSKLVLQLRYALLKSDIFLLKLCNLFFESLGLFTQNGIGRNVCDKLYNAHGVSYCYPLNVTFHFLYCG